VIGGSGLVWTNREVKSHVFENRATSKQGLGSCGSARVHTMIGRSLIILAVTTLGATAVVAQSSKVTVHRGSDTHTIEIDSQGYAVAPKVRIERVPQGPTETAAQANTRIHVTGVSGPAAHAQLGAGQTLWLTGTTLLAPPRFVLRCYTEDGCVARPGTTLRRWLPRDVFRARNRPAHVSAHVSWR
jgi:hypothetical protein